MSCVQKIVKRKYGNEPLLHIIIIVILSFLRQPIRAHWRSHFLSATHYCWVDSSICESLIFHRIAKAQWNLWNLAQCLVFNPQSSDHMDYALANIAMDLQCRTRTERVKSMTRERFELAISRLAVRRLTPLHHWVVHKHHSIYYHL